MEKKVPWGFRDIAIVFVGYIVAAKVASLVIRDMFWLYLVNNAILVTFVLLYVWRKYNINAKDFGFRFARWPKDVILGLSGAASLFVIANVAVAQLIDEPVVHPIVRMVMDAKNPGDLVVPFAMAGIIAPIAEETFYRGMFFTTTRKRFGLLVGAIIAGTFFAIFHLKATWLEVGVVGVGLCFIYEWSGDLLAPILTHSVLNSLQLLVAFLRSH